MEDIKFLLEFSESGTLEKVIRDLELLDNKYDAFRDKITKTNTSLVNASDSKEISGLTDQVKRLQEEYAALMKETKAADDQKKKSKELTKEQVTEEERRRQAINNVRKEAREQLKDETALTLAANKQVRSIKDLREQNNALVRLRDRVDQTTKQGKRLFDEYTKSIAKNEQALKDYDKQIGRSQRYVGDYQRAFKGLGTQILTLAGVTGGIAFFQNAIDQIGKFDQSLADLRAILGLTADDPKFKFLNEQALELGKTTSASAVEVVEAYKLIGSAKPELLDNVDALNQVTKAAITLADASGLALPEAATALTDAMNQFGASADEAQRYIDALANGAKYGAAEIPQITEALLKFGVAAKASNVNIEESTAVIETFAEKGLKGAEAGTAFRNILLKMSAVKALSPEALNQLKQAKVDIDKISNSSISYTERLRELSKIQNNSTALVKVFGVENEVAAQALLQNVDRVEQLTGKMGEYGTAAAQAKERTNTVEGELKKLANTWQATIIEFGKGGGQLKDIVRFIRENLKTIVNTVITVTKYFVLYKAAVIATKGAFDLASFASKAYSVAINALKGNLGGALSAFKALDGAMKANVIGLVVTGVVALIDAFDLFETAADRAAAAQDRVNKAQEAYKLLADNERTQLEKNVELIAKKYDFEIAKAGENKSKVTQLEREKQSAIESEYLSRIQRARIRRINADKEQLKDAEALAKKELEIRETFNDAGVGALSNAQDREKAVLERTLKEREKLLKSKKGYKEALDAEKEFSEKLDEIRKNGILRGIKERASGNEDIETLTKKEIEARKKALEDEYQALIKQIESEKTLEETAILRTKDSEEKKADNKLQAELSFLEKKLVIDQAFNKDFEKTELELVAKKVEIENRELERRRKFYQQLQSIQKQVDDQEIQNTEDKYEKERLLAQKDFEDKIAQVDEQRKQIEANDKLTYYERKQAIEELNALEEGMKKELINKLKKINEDATNEEVESKVKKYNDAYKQIELDTLKSGKNQEQIDIDLQKNDIDRLKDEIEIRQEAGQDTLDLEIELQRKLEKLREDEAARRKKLLQQVISETVDAYNAISQAYDQVIQKRLDADQMALDKQKENVDLQQQRAIAGQENTLEQEKAIQAEKEKQLLIDQKKQEKAKKIEAFFNALAEYSKSDPNTAPAKAFIQTQIADALVSKFEEGGVVDDVTSREGNGGRIKNGIFKGRSHRRGGILIEAEGEEGIFSKTEMRNLGKDNFYALKDRLNRPIDELNFREQNERMQAAIVVKQEKADFTPLMNKFDDMIKAIEDKPVSHMYIDPKGHLVTVQEAKNYIKKTIHKRKGFNG